MTGKHDPEPLAAGRPGAREGREMDAETQLFVGVLLAEKGADTLMHRLLQTGIAARLGKPGALDQHAKVRAEFVARRAEWGATR